MPAGVERKLPKYAMTNVQALFSADWSNDEIEMSRCF